MDHVSALQIVRGRFKGRGVRVAAACGLLLWAGVNVAGSAHPCGASEPQEGFIPGAGNLQLGAPLLFDDGIGINSGRCFPLLNEGQFVTWLHSYHRVGPRFFVQRCDADTQSHPMSPGSRSGAVADDYVELSFDDAGRPAFAEVAAPLWSAHSNPSFCNSYMAYWGTEFGKDGVVKVHAIVFDLGNRRVVRKDLLGDGLLESDSRDFFERPRWNSDAGKVTFCGRDDRLPGSLRIERRQFKLGKKTNH